ncbi:MAG: multiprotein-bridging factor 1 family protein [Bacteroidaceae bacterium]
MRRDEKGNALFRQIIDETPEETKKRLEWQFDISDRIFGRLQELGMTQKEFAKRMNTSPASVNRWIGGGQNFTISTLAKISTVLGIPLISIAK